jgi:hypothetical protein
MVSKRDLENARLRDQREQQAAELNERKHKDNVKLASMQELRALSESRSASVSYFHKTVVVDRQIGAYLSVGIRTSTIQSSTCRQCEQ